MIAVSGQTVPESIAPPADLTRGAITMSEENKNAGEGQWWRRWRRRFSWAAIAGAIGLVLVTLAANVVVRMVARPFLYVLAADVTAPIAIVPGASVHRDGSPSPQLAERLSAALGLARAGRVQRILVSGARNGAYDEAGPMRRWLTQRGLHPSAVVDDHAGFRTLDTMERAARVYDVRRAVVCTQSFHLPRAVFLARRAGIDAVGLASDGASPGGSAGDSVRESLADLMAVIDSYVLRRQPRDPGPRVPRLDAGTRGAGG